MRARNRENTSYRADLENLDLDLHPVGFLLYGEEMAHFQMTRRVEFCETDLAGIVHFANYYRYMEQAEHEFFRSLQLKIHGQFPDGTTYGWPRVAASANFSAPAYYDDLLEIRLTILKRTRRSLTISYEFFRDQSKLASGEMKTAFCRVPNQGRIESADIPDEIAAALGAIAPIL